MTFATRPLFEWRLRTRSIELGRRTLLMGILNVTPDSFSDGGQYLNAGDALDRALEMLDQGADLLDLGGESTRPNAVPLTSREEQTRVLPVLRSILAAWPDALVSIDTYHSETARAAVGAGAEIVNDVSGHLWDPAMSATCASLGCGAVLMHTRGRPHQWSAQSALEPGEVLPLVLDGLATRVGAAIAAGVARESIVLDPGFGFGKISDENYSLLAGLEQFQALGFPLLVGLSRKSFLTRALRSEAGTLPRAAEPWRLPTAAANTAAILAGGHILRVHDIGPAREIAAVADQILQAGLS